MYNRGARYINVRMRNGVAKRGGKGTKKTSSMNTDKKVATNAIANNVVKSYRRIGDLPHPPRF